MQTDEGFDRIDEAMAMYQVPENNDAQAVEDLLTELCGWCRSHEVDVSKARVAFDKDAKRRQAA